MVIKKINFIFTFITLLVVLSCKEEIRVKPKAQLRLQYPVPEYNNLKTHLPFSFLKNNAAGFKNSHSQALNLEYPFMKATIYLTYQPINNNLEALLIDAQKLTYDHTIKADEILEQPRIDTLNKVYGMFYTINGNAATQSQFYVTDSIRHFVKGALYFNAKPNYDSIYPAVVYLRNDIRTIMETISWE